MRASIKSLKNRTIQVHHLQERPELVTLTVEMLNDHGIKLGLSIGLSPDSASLNSKDVNVLVFGKGHFNPVVFPAEGSLPELRSRSGRCAVAAFEFAAVEKDSRATGAELTLRGKQYRILFSKAAGSKESNGRNGIPASVAKVLPTSWPKRSK